MNRSVSSSQAAPAGGAVQPEGEAGGAAQPEGQAGQADEAAQPEQQGEAIGELSDLIVDMREGKIVYGILTRTDGQLVAVPFSALQYETSQEQFVLDIEPQTLDQLAFAQDSWPDMTSEQWASTVHEQFNREPYWQVFGYGSPGQPQQQQQQQEQQQQQQGPGAQPEESY
jgi:hypothetical protein